MRESKIIAKKAMDILSNNQNIEILRLTSEELLKTLQAFQEQKTAFSFVDISLKVLAETRSARIITFDKKLEKALLKAEK